MSGRMAAWDAAVIRRDRAAMIAVLMATELTEKQAEQTADAVLAKR